MYNYLIKLLLKGVVNIHVPWPINCCEINVITRAYGFKDATDQLKNELICVQRYIL